MAPKTVVNISRVLTKALNDAVNLGLVTRNVATKVARPQVTKPEINAWSAAELRAFRTAAKDEPLSGIWHLASSTGMRRGEEGVPVKVVSERLGHSSAAFTIDQYQHLLPGMQAAAAALFASVVEAADDQVGADTLTEDDEALPSG